MLTVFVAALCKIGKYLFIIAIDPIGQTILVLLQLGSIRPTRRTI